MLTNALFIYYKDTDGVYYISKINPTPNGLFIEMGYTKEKTKHQFETFRLFDAPKNSRFLKVTKTEYNKLKFDK